MKSGKVFVVLLYQLFLRSELCERMLVKGTLLGVSLVCVFAQLLFLFCVDVILKYIVVIVLDC